MKDDRVVRRSGQSQACSSPTSVLTLAQLLQGQGQGEVSLENAALSPLVPRAAPAFLGLLFAFGLATPMMLRAYT